MSVSFYAAYPQRTIQIVLRRHACVADVLFGFDVDACQLAYDGARVLATPSAVRAFRTGVNIADPERSSSTYEKRLVKYSRRGFAVAVPGLDISRVSRQYTSGVFTWVGSSLRRLSLTFGGADMPAYSLDTRDIVGLPRLLLFAGPRTQDPYFAPALLTGRPTESATVRINQDVHPHGDSPKDDCGTFLVDLKLLGRYGLSNDPGAVWRRPTPPHAPPADVQLRWGDAEALLADDGYTGVLLPYWDYIRSPRQLLEVIDLEEHASRPEGVAFCYQFLELGAEGADDGIPHIEDAASQHPVYLRTGANQELPRYLEFPSSTATGTANPFARLPAENWFGDVYSRDEWVDC